MKFSLSVEQKRQAYESVKQELEKSLILRLSILNIDPENFNEDTFVPDENSTAQKDIYDLICKIKDIDNKILSI